MIPEFIDFCHQIFPHIDPYTKEQAKIAMQQFEGISRPSLTKIESEPDLYQGDIFSEIPFFYYDKDGQQRLIRRKAQLLSNTCDATRDDMLLFAALHPLKDFSGNISMVDNIKKNRKYSAFYLNDTILSDEYIDFEMINTFSREAFNKLLQEKKVRRIASLTLVGYYMFICKLSIFFMRPEDVEVNSSRAYKT